MPCIVRWPERINGGQTCAIPVTTADLLPTLCDATGVGIPRHQPVDGTSWLPLLLGEVNALTRDAIYFHYPHYHHSRPASAIRKGEWKLIEFLDDHTVEMYNLNDDIGETRNVATSESRLADSLLAQLHGWRDGIGARMPSINPNYDPQRAGEWWSRRDNRRLDVEAMRKRYESRTRSTN